MGGPGRAVGRPISLTENFNLDHDSFTFDWIRKVVQVSAVQGGPMAPRNKFGSTVRSPQFLPDNFDVVDGEAARRAGTPKTTLAV